VRAADGWITAKGLVNSEIEVSRSFGVFHLLPAVNARPDVTTWELSPLDEFVIIASRGLWDFVSEQTAVDIARSERENPTLAAQKLRDVALSYGCEDSIMVMVISVSKVFGSSNGSRRPTAGSLLDGDNYASSLRKRRKNSISDRNLSRLDGEVAPPRGHLALVFTDIRNSTHLWEANACMPAAMRLHNNLLRRLLRLCGGYEVKTEGDAFMCAFQHVLSAVWWCLTVQEQLQQEPWPTDILECEDGRELYDAAGRVIARGLSVRMGIHFGAPICELDPITRRLDFFGSVVNKAARVSGSAKGGQIMCSAEVIHEINASVLQCAPETEFTHLQPSEAVDAIRHIGVTIADKGEFKLKGIEAPVHLALIYASSLVGREELLEAKDLPTVKPSRGPVNIEEMRQLGLLCIRLEALTTGRVFRPLSAATTNPSEAYFNCDPSLLLPAINENASDLELAFLLDALSIRIENALAALLLKQAPGALSHPPGIQINAK
jgi:adenylate cyclase